MLQQHIIRKINMNGDARLFVPSPCTIHPLTFHCLLCFHKGMAKLSLILSTLAAIASANDFGPDALSSIGAKRTCIQNTSPDYDSERCFYTYIPTCAGANAPLVFDIHG